jgi:hypothetical protein
VREDQAASDEFFPQNSFDVDFLHPAYTGFARKTDQANVGELPRRISAERKLMIDEFH